jgi:hypothetical protein
LAAVHMANVLEEREQAAGMGGSPVVANLDYLRGCRVDPDMSKWEALCHRAPSRAAGR